LLLDDVFSELDPDRARRLVAALPLGQTIISSAVPLPRDVQAATVIDVATLGVTSG
jgi:recombinational DNA repair ATPase RecF